MRPPAGCRSCPRTERRCRGSPSATAGFPNTERFWPSHLRQPGRRARSTSLPETPAARIARVPGVAIGLSPKHCTNGPGNRGRMDNKARNRRLMEKASQQHGLISREQAVGLKFSHSGIDRRLESGQWTGIRLGVYRVGAVASSWRQELMSACLWIGPEAVASHTSAARLLKLDGVPVPAIEVTTSKPRNPERTGVVVHRSRSLPTEDRTVIDGIPCTRAARTIIDLASAIEGHQLELALEDALRRRLIQVPWVYRRLRVLGTNGRRGTQSLARFLSERHSGEALTDSALEARVFQLLRKAGLPRPERQFMVTTDEELIARVDFAYPKQRLIIEADGYRYHQDLKAWTHDRDRLNRLAADGWRVMHARWKDVTVGQDRFVKRVQVALQPSKQGRGR